MVECIPELLADLVMAKRIERIVNGCSMYEAALRATFVSTGCDTLNSYLQGGFLAGEVSELAGPSNVGKTQLCVTAAVIAAASHRVIYMESSGLMAQRFAEIALRRNIARSADDLKRMLSRIHVCHVGDASQLICFLEQLEDEGTASIIDSTDSVLPFSLLIVDSGNFLLSSVTCQVQEKEQSNHLLATVGRLLRKLARQLNIAVLITNKCFVHSSNDVHIGLGQWWRLVAATRLIMWRPEQVTCCSDSVPGGFLVRVMLERSCRTQCSSSLDLIVNEFGLVSRQM